MALSASLATAEALVQLQQQLAEAYSDLERCRARPAALRPLDERRSFRPCALQGRVTSHAWAVQALCFTSAPQGAALCQQGSQRCGLRAHCARPHHCAAWAPDEAQHVGAVAAEARAAGDPARSRRLAGRGAMLGLPIDAGRAPRRAGRVRGAAARRARVGRGAALGGGGRGGARGCGPRRARRRARAAGRDARGPGGARGRARARGRRRGGRPRARRRRGGGRRGRACARGRAGGAARRAARRAAGLPVRGARAPARPSAARASP